jgi:hypothetical protein
MVIFDTCLTLQDVDGTHYPFFGCNIKLGYNQKNEQRLEKEGPKYFSNLNVFLIQTSADFEKQESQSFVTFFEHIIFILHYFLE